MSFPRFVDTDTHALRKLLRNTAEVINTHGRIRVNGATASERTFRQTHEVMAAFSRRLHRLGFFIEDTASLREKHIRAVVRSWYEDRMAAKTMQNQYSRVKIFCGWIGKTDIINRERKGIAHYLPEAQADYFRVKTIAEQSKSWSGNGLDPKEILQRAFACDYRHGVMLSMGLTFGLRKKEMLLLKPWRADKGEYLEIADNVAKNGRYRIIPIEDGELGRAQRSALNLAKAMCKKIEPMGWPNMTLKQAENRYFYRMRQLGLTKESLGVTGHGSRAEYAEVTLMLAGVVPPTLGGDAAKVPAQIRDAAMTKVSQALGHNDTHTSGAYYGSFARPQAMNRLGGRIGPTIVLSAQPGVTATLWCNPAPRPDEGGKISIPRSSRRKTSLRAIVEGGVQTEELAVDEVVRRWPSSKPTILDQVSQLGIDLAL